MASPETWTLDDVREKVHVPDWVAVNRLFSEGEHFQDGAGWIAPMPPKGSEEYMAYKEGAKRGFVSSNKIAEVEARHAHGVIGRVPTRRFESRAPIPKGETLPAALQALTDKAGGLHKGFWDRNGVHGRLQPAVRRLLHSARCPMYLVIPPGLLVDDPDRTGRKRLPDRPAEELLGLIRVRFPLPEQCTVYTDPDTLREVGIYLYRVGEEDRADLSWVDEDGMTVLRQIGKAGDRDEPLRYDFGERIPFFEMRRELFITPQIRQNQMALNLALSSIPRNTWTAGARARALFNVDLPGKEEVQPDGTTRFVPDPLLWGAHAVNVFQGAAQYDKDGKFSGYANPSMEVEEPVEIRPSREAVEAHAWEILSEADQLHAWISGDAVASAVSRVMARADFVGSLLLTKPTVDAALEWLMETPLAMADAFKAGPETQVTPTYTGDLKAEAKCRLDSGPVTPEEMRIINELVKDGRLSEETALVMLGVENVREERERIEAERRVERFLDTLARGMKAGLTRYGVAKVLLKLSEEEALALERGDVPDGVEQ